MIRELLPEENDSGQGDVALRVLVISDNAAIKDNFPSAPGGSNLSLSYATYANFMEIVSRTSPQIILAELNTEVNFESWQDVADLKKKRRLPIIAFFPASALDAASQYQGYDDFLLTPINSVELALRIGRLVKTERENSELIICDDLTIDTATCEVTIDGVKVDLTFKEYELLKLLAASRGRVFTREALLDKIWGYDYFGGDRTVDVHVRRLRSKIEDANHSYIETVRNIGYKFIKSNNGNSNGNGQQA
jgi:two-component system, OmpR family, alkaline phosphatase synthesis response regulator PhoP